jgi:LacI family transcriptional regulator
MVLKQNPSIGIVLPYMFNIFQRQLLSIIEKQMESLGYQSLLFLVSFDTVSEEECLVKIKSETLDGLLLVQEIQSPDFYEYLKQRNIPTVSVTFVRPGIPAVHLNEEQSAFEAVMHLVNLGHRHIAMLNSSGFSFARERAEGYFRALESVGINRDEVSVVTVPHFTPEAGVYGMRGLLMSNKPTTAVFAVSDELALGAMRALHDHGLRTPEDISVVGFDDIDIANFTIPRLTTIRQPIQEMGERATMMLHRRILGTPPSAANVILDHRLIIRESTAHI